MKSAEFSIPINLRIKPNHKISTTNQNMVVRREMDCLISFRCRPSHLRIILLSDNLRINLCNKATLD